MKPTLEVKQYDAYLSSNNKSRSTFTYIDVVKVDEPDEAVLEIAYDRKKQVVEVRSMDPNYELVVRVELLPEPTLVIYDTHNPIFKKPLKEL